MYSVYSVCVHEITFCVVGLWLVLNGFLCFTCNMIYFVVWPLLKTILSSNEFILLISCLIHLVYALSLSLSSPLLSSPLRYTGKDVAVKIIKNVPKYRAAARIEIRVLEQIRDIVEDGQE